MAANIHLHSARRLRLLAVIPFLITVLLAGATSARADYYYCAPGLVQTGTADDQANGSACAYWLLPSFPLGGTSRPELNGNAVPGIDVLPIWTTTRGAGVTVAVVDTGVDAQGPDLRSNLLPGWNFVDGNADTNDANGHGTVLASIIAAPANNGAYIGIAPEARVLPVKIMGSGEFNDKAAVAGIRYAIKQGARVINASFGGLNHPMPGMDEALVAARRANVLVVIAAGNDGVNLDSGRYTQTPNGYGLSNAITVANFSNHGHLNADSNHGPRHVQVAALGDTLWGDYPGYFGGGYLGGTSAAAATVSGVAALLFSAFPKATAEQVRAAIISGATRIPDLAGKVEASGVVSASGAMKAMLHPRAGLLPVPNVNPPVNAKRPQLMVAKGESARFALWHGPFRVGQRLGTSMGAWRSRNGLKLRIAWQRCAGPNQCTDVYAAESPTYGNGGDGTIPASDRGFSLVAQITAVTSVGRETTVTTRSTGLILPARR